MDALPAETPDPELASALDATESVLTRYGAPVNEGSSMATGTGAGTRVLLYGDFSQNYIVDRWPGHVLFEPFITGTGVNAQLPSGNSGFFFFWRVGMGQTTTGAWRVGKN